MCMRVRISFFLGGVGGGGHSWRELVGNLSSSVKRTIGNV